MGGATTEQVVQVERKVRTKAEGVVFMYRREQKPTTSSSYSGPVQERKSDKKRHYTRDWNMKDIDFPIMYGVMTVARTADESGIQLRM